MSRHTLNPIEPPRYVTRMPGGVGLIRDSLRRVVVLPGDRAPASTNVAIDRISQKNVWQHGTCAGMPRNGPNKPARIQSVAIRSAWVAAVGWLRRGPYRSTHC
jgi:hypothetical protein